MHRILYPDLTLLSLGWPYPDLSFFIQKKERFNELPEGHSFFNLRDS